MKVYFIRHGETQYNVENRVYGWAPAPLTEKGVEEVKRARKLIPKDFSVIFSSDLVRCKETAEMLNEELKLPVIFDARLRERNFGTLEGKTWEEMGEVFYQKDKTHQYDYQSFGGESVEDVQGRVFSFIRDIMKNREKEKILVVTHGGVIRLLHYLLGGKVLELPDVTNLSLHEFEFSDPSLYDKYL